MRLSTLSSAALAAAIFATPALPASDADKAEALRSAAEALRGAIETLEEAAATLEDGAGSEGDASAGRAGSQAAEPASGGAVAFLHPLDNKPIEFDLRPDQQITPQVEEFHRTAENPYRGDDQAIAEGKKLYNKLCKACHLEDGTGRIGPNLIDDTWKYDRADTDQGKFEVIYAGGAGAMQAFGKRIDQDEVLKVMAYMEVLGQQ